MPSKAKRWKLLVLVVLLGAGLGFFYLRSLGTNSPNFLESIAYRLVHPLARGIGGGVSYLGTLGKKYLLLFHVKEESIQAKSKIRELSRRLLDLEEENRSLRRQKSHELNLGEGWGEALLARVVGYDPKSALRSITLNKGRKQGVRLGQVAVADGGLVGRVFRVRGNSSQVLLVDDLRSVVDVLAARSRAQGTLSGKRSALSLGRERRMTQAEYIDGKEEIFSGDLLLSSGMDGIFPKGIPVGIVEDVKKDGTGLFWRATAQPYVELNKLEEVLLISNDGNRGFASDPLEDS